MKSEKRTIHKVIAETFWTCNIESHRHRSKVVAEACIKKRGKPVRGKEDIALRAHRNLAIIEQKISGKATVEIARSFGMSSNYVHQITSRYRRLSKWPRIKEHEESNSGVFKVVDTRVKQILWKPGLAELIEKNIPDRFPVKHGR